MQKQHLFAKAIGAIVIVLGAIPIRAELPEVGNEPRARLAIPPRPQERNITKLLVDSKQAYRRLAEGPGSSVPNGVKQSADCVVIVPLGLTPSSVFGQRRAQGVLSCKDHRRQWSLPAVLDVELPRESGWSVPSDIVIFMRGQEAQAALASESIVLGRELGAERGPRGKTATGLAVSDWNGAYWYSRGRGDLLGLTIADDPRGNATLYGPGADREGILSNDGSMAAPAAAAELRATLG